MAVPTGTFLTYSAIGNREDLTDIIYNVDPTDTPFFTGIPQNDATAVLHEWQTDTLDTASEDNASLEGDDAPEQALTPTVRLPNTLQIQTKVARVSGSQQAVVAAGRRDELAYQIYKKSLSLRRDGEKSLLANKVRNAGDATTPRTMAGIETWINTNADIGATGTKGANGTTLRVAGTLRAFTETGLKSVIKGCWDAGGDPDCIMTGSDGKQKISTFSGNATRFKGAEDRTLVAAIDMYESDFGTLEVKANRFTNQAAVHVLQSDLWADAVLRPMHLRDLAKTGDSDRRQLLWEHTLEARNEKASGSFFDIDWAL